MQLTSKEKSYLQDAKKHEEMCVKKKNNSMQNRSLMLCNNAVGIIPKATNKTILFSVSV
ncbi:hypothetical protein [Selenihalanaerobacter shriftii]|uniref:Uncharacterized protein n=1 Tax=Selenihalanaerobacter shriftii TaxID=142842 RepID=A0A1T4MH85_9FIRM|nr:hypothetical protein [Selenihalanaerobacter shriftii]SJZ66273.1 hypothetical protein SAMN02745118_01465 [Selenihalanaerobacter shriftii]